MEPVDPEVSEMYAAYAYCKLFHCTLDEYESRPAKETQWMLAIDGIYNQAVNDANEKANKDASMRQ